MITAIEKTLTCLAMPCGLIWMGLIVLSWLAWRRKQRAMLVSLLLVFYTLAGNQAVSKVLIARLERDFIEIEPLEQGPYDAVVILGGGTRTAINGQSQLSAAGDRVALGARLYHAGRTQRLIATGRHGSACEASEIWRQWAVREEDIVLLSGRNTREEMAAVRRMVEEHPEWNRFGLVTSAWHMRRAMRLAGKNDLSLDPLPADFLGNRVRWEPCLLIIPNGTGFLHNQLACKEILACITGR